MFRLRSSAARQSDTEQVGCDTAAALHCDFVMSRRPPIIAKCLALLNPQARRTALALSHRLRMHLQVAVIKLLRSFMLVKSLHSPVSMLGNI